MVEWLKVYKFMGLLVYEFRRQPHPRPSPKARGDADPRTTRNEKDLIRISYSE
jgi:hypothetical protein